MTTVGYGDKAPRTGAGRVVATIWMFAAIILISSFTAAFTTSLTVKELGTIVTGPSDLYKVTVGTVTSSTAAEYLRDKRIVATGFANVDAAVHALSAGTVDAVVYDAPILRYLLKQDDTSALTVLPSTFRRQEYAIALPSGDPLREPVNLQLEAFIDSEEWRQLLFSYLGQED